MADRAAFFVLGSVPDIEVAEKTDVNGDLHMLALDDIGMAAPAVEVYSPSVPGEMGFVIKYNLPSGKIDLRFYQSHLMAPCLEALGVGHIRERSGVVGACHKAELT